MNGLEQMTRYLFGIEEDAPVEQDKIEKVECALETLSEHDRTLITERYGIGQDRPRTLAELAEAFGTDREAIRHAEDRILRALKKQIK